MAIFVNNGGNSGDQQAFGFACSRSGFGSQSTSIRVTAESGGLKVNTPYNADFVSLYCQAAEQKIGVPRFV